MRRSSIAAGPSARTIPFPSSMMSAPAAFPTPCPNSSMTAAAAESSTSASCPTTSRACRRSRSGAMRRRNATSSPSPKIVSRHSSSSANASAPRSPSVGEATAEKEGLSSRIHFANTPIDHAARRPAWQTAAHAPQGDLARRARSTRSTSAASRSSRRPNASSPTRPSPTRPSSSPSATAPSAVSSAATRWSVRGRCPWPIAP